MLGSRDMKDEGKVLRYVMNPRAHRQCSDLLYNLFTGTSPLPCKTNKRRASTRKNYGEGGSESEKSESIELQWASKIEHSVVHYICTV